MITFLDKCKTAVRVFKNPESIEDWASRMPKLNYDRHLAEIILNNPFLREIVWPDPSNLDDWDKLHYLSIVKEFCASISGRSLSGKPTFDVCIIHRLKDLGLYEITPSTQVLQNRLRAIHMWKLAEIPNPLLVLIPRMLSAIFTEGREGLHEYSESLELSVWTAYKG